MEIKINRNNYDNYVRTIETHASGEYCRVLVDCPDVPDGTMLEKKNYLAEHYDYLRSALMNEPRGHNDMTGTIVTAPSNPEADCGIIFMDTADYLNMCGHCVIGSVTAVLEGGIVEMKEPQTEVVLDTPAGLVRTVANCKDGKVTGVVMTNVPSFTYLKDLETEYEGQKIVYDICYGGSFFCLVDTDKNFGFRVSTDKAAYLKKFSSFLLKEVEATIKVKHPELDITSVDLVTSYSSTESNESNYRTLNAFGNFDNPQLDRSPGGTATSALMSLLYEKGELKLGDDFVSESMMGARFKCKIAEETMVGDYKAIIPTVEGAGYLAGLSEWFIDPDDPLGTGFVVPI